MSALLEFYVELEKNISWRNSILRKIAREWPEKYETPEGKKRIWGYTKGVIKRFYQNAGQHLWDSASRDDHTEAEKIMQKIIVEDIEKLRQIFFGEASVDLLNNNQV